jgi:hypothetical protein
MYKQYSVEQLLVSELEHTDTYIDKEKNIQIRTLTKKSSNRQTDKCLLRQTRKGVTAQTLGVGMRAKLALAGEGGGARPPPLITFTITSKVAVYAPAEWTDTLTLFHL